MNASKLIKAAKHLDNISEFIWGEGMKDALSIIGDTHLESAKLAFEFSEISSTPIDRINSALTHLEAAHSVYERGHKKADNFIWAFTDWQSIRSFAIKDVWVCCLMALCYLWLGDKQSAIKSLSLAERAFANKDKKLNQIKKGDTAEFIVLPIIAIALLNPRNWDLRGAGLIDEKQFLEFKFAMESIANSSELPKKLDNSNILGSRINVLDGKIIPVSPKPRTINAFFCHSTADKPKVRDLYKRLLSDNIDIWFDEEKLLPGQDWDLEINKAIREADIILVFLSKNSVSKEGYIQKEIKRALAVAEEKPEGMIFIIPVRLDNCEIPQQFQRWHWINVSDNNSYERLLSALRVRAASLDNDT